MNERILRLLVVEDDPEDLVILRDLLSVALPHVRSEVQWAQSFEQALDLLENGPDLCFFDYMLGARTGLELLRETRARGLQVPVILLTGHGGEELAVEALKAGAVDYLPKSRLNETSLRLAVHHAINVRQKEELLRRSRNALCQSEQRFRGLVENSSDVTALIDATGEIQYAAQSVARVFGYAPAELVGVCVFDRIHNDDRASAQEMLSRVIADPADLAVGELRCLRQDGSWLVIESTICNRLADPAIAAIVLNGRDVTERKCMEDALRRSERDYRNLFEGANDAIVIFEPQEEIILEVNQNACALYGYSREELIGRSLRMVSVDEQHGAEHIADVLAHGAGRNFETTHVRSDGTSIHVVANSSVIEYRGRRAILTINRDISELRRLQEQFLQAQKMEAVGNLAGGIAHDFNNLLMVMTSYSEMLLNSLSDGRQRRQAEQVLKASRRAADLTRQLLAFSRKQRLEPRVIDLNAVIRDMDKILSGLLGGNIEVDLHLSPRTGSTRADPTQMQQVLMNLVVNARDAMPTGGRLVIETSAVEVDASAAGITPGRYVTFAVTDTGSGIPPEVVPHIFEPFYTTKEQGKGTGLGLSTVYGIVQQSGGQVFVDSVPGRGTTFKIFLPQVDEKPSVPATAPEIRADGNETILLVDDEEDLRAALHEFLKRHGYRVLEARNGEEAIMLAKQVVGPIHLLLTDVMMPGALSGPDVARRLRQMHPETVAIYMSGFAESAVLQRGGPEPPAQFLQKPFSFRTLGQTIRQVLDLQAPAAAVSSEAGRRAAAPAW